jgi:hypothetical protein
MMTVDMVNDSMGGNARARRLSLAKKLEFQVYRNGASRRQRCQPPSEGWWKRFHFVAKMPSDDCGAIPADGFG